MGSAAERTERLYAQLMVEHKALGRLYDELEISLAGELSDLRSSVARLRDEKLRLQEQYAMEARAREELEEEVAWWKQLAVRNGIEERYGASAGAAAATPHQRDESVAAFESFQLSTPAGGAGFSGSTFAPGSHHFQDVANMSATDATMFGIRRTLEEQIPAVGAASSFATPRGAAAATVVGARSFNAGTWGGGMTATGVESLGGVSTSLVMGRGLSATTSAQSVSRGPEGYTPYGSLGETKTENECGRCGSSNLTSYQLPSRDATVGPRTFCQCSECGHHWKLDLGRSGGQTASMVSATTAGSVTTTTTHTTLTTTATSA